MRAHYSHSIACLVVTICAYSAFAQTPGGTLTSDEGGANGYQHSIERSRFVAGSSVEQLRPIEEFGFSKLVGPSGMLATDLRNGLRHRDAKRWDG